MEFTNAQEIHKNYPNTFKVPCNAELKALEIGDLVMVKISACRVRFWVKITNIANSLFTGRVDNDLIPAENHGLSCDDIIQFETKHIYTVYPT